MKYGLLLAVCLAVAGCDQKKEPEAPDMASMDVPTPTTPPPAAPVAQIGDILISDPWAPVTPAGGRVAAGYLTLKNVGPSEDTLTGFSSPSAKTVELHEMLTENGMMKMQAKTDLVLKPGEEVALAPGGLHLMLMEPSLPFDEGEELPLTLTFAKAGKVDIKLIVRPRLPDAAAEHDGH